MALPLQLLGLALNGFFGKEFFISSAAFTHYIYYTPKANVCMLARHHPRGPGGSLKFVLYLLVSGRHYTLTVRYFTGTPVRIINQTSEEIMKKKRHYTHKKRKALPLVTELQLTTAQW